MKNNNSENSPASAGEATPRVTIDQLDNLYPGDWALHLIRVAPADVGGKQPLDKGWPKLPAKRKKGATSPREILEEMALHANDKGNIGLVPIEDTLALDFDDQESAAQAIKLAPDAPRQRTGKGVHIFFRRPDGLGIGNATGTLLACGLKCDICSEGGQVVCAPSLHTSGKRYTWEVPLPPSIDDLPTLPSELYPSISIPSLAENDGPPPAPVDVLPEAMQRYCKEVAASLCSSEATTLCCMLASVLGTAGDFKSVQLKTDWTTNSNFWLCIVGDPGVGKTPVSTHVLQPLKTLNTERFKKFKDELTRWKKLNAKAKGKEANSCEPAPVWRQMIVNDTTPEALCDVLEGSKRLLGFYDEFGTLTGSFGRYTGAQNSDQSTLCSIYSGTNLTVNRRGRDTPLCIDRPCISIIAFTQPTPARLLFQSDDKTGFLDRFSFVHAESQGKVFDRPSISTPAKEAWQSVISTLASDNQRVSLSLTPEARNQFKRIYEEERNGPAAMAGYRDKYAEKVAKLGLALTLMRDPKAVEIDEMDMLGAEILAEWLYHHTGALRCESLVGKELLSTSANALLARLKKRGLSEIRRGEIPKMNIKGLKTADLAQAALDELQRLGAMTRIESRNQSDRLITSYRLTDSPGEVKYLGDLRGENVKGAA